MPVNCSLCLVNQLIEKKMTSNAQSILFVMIVVLVRRNTLFLSDYRNSEATSLLVENNADHL